MNCPMNRRTFLGQLGVGAASLATGVAIGETGKERPPNVVLIVSDDQGFGDVDCYGAEDLRTPNLDALAGSGVRFTQFYTAAPICSPARAALLTGLYPQRAGLANNAYAGTGLPPERTTIAESFREAGYRTALFGKWHLGNVPEKSPLKQGFDEFFGHKEGCIDNYSHFFYWAGPNRHDLWRNDEEHHEDGAFFPDLVVREACRFIGENRDRPFFLYLPFNLPHYPLQAEERFRDMYSRLDKERARYAAVVSSLDEKIGRVIETLDVLELRENTIVVFMSDNGHSVEERTFGGGGSAGPYRGHKFTLFEGGIRVPCIVSWPGQIPAGKVCAQPVISMDWFPALASWCGAPLPDEPLDGVNLAEMITRADAPMPKRTLHWMVQDQWAVRDGDWKLIANAPETGAGGNMKSREGIQLFGLVEDPSEETDLSGQHPEIVERLTRLHEEWTNSSK